MCTYVHVYVSGVQRTTLMSQLSPTMWVPGIRLGRKGLYLELFHRPSILLSKLTVLYLEYFQFPICSAGREISSSLARLRLLWAGVSTKHHSQRRVGSGVRSGSEALPSPGRVPLRAPSFWACRQNITQVVTSFHRRSLRQSLGHVKRRTVACVLEESS